MSGAVSMATAPLAPSQAMKGALGTRRLDLLSSVRGRIVCIPHHKRDVVRMCVGETRVAAEVAKKVAAENKDERVPAVFTLVDVYDFICR